ncbi:cytochrome P450 [Streptomyces sp. FH025]|uniref:cytochrome P450 n=1 Tax=Streptomyces sp. FH025 TaxID=2815937 RepID=UPI001A9DCEDD|nr:cytochrome P450 [Streptomyces sp. FH025]MBO1413662.1 cytochrome P450 [Streptomyces sp. FH025]
MTSTPPTPSMAGPELAELLYGDYSAADPREALRAMATVPAMKDPRTGALFVTGYDLVRELLLHPGLTSATQRDPLAGTGLSEEQIALHRPVRDFVALWPVFSDGAYHQDLRSRIRPALDRRVVAALAADLENDCRELLAGLRGTGGECDWIGEFCRPYSLATLARLFGTSADRMTDLAEATDGLMAYLAKPRSYTDDDLAREANASLDRLRAEVREHLLERAEGELAVVLRDIAADPALGPEVAVAVTAQIVTGTLEPLAAVLTEVVMRGGERMASIAGPEAESASAQGEFTEEVLRISCPFRFAPRYALQDMEIAGHQVAAGQRVMLILAAANLDATVFPDPLAWRPGAHEAHSLAFSAGSHYCVGAPLARGATDALTRVLAADGLRVSHDPATFKRAAPLGSDRILGLRVRIH